jgi:hypothetical protein
MTNAMHRIAESLPGYQLSASNRERLTVVSQDGSIETANQVLEQLSGVQDYFPDADAMQRLLRLITRKTETTSELRQREMGDFQTPLPLASRVCRYLVDAGVKPRVIIEPTFGTGNFILAAIDSFPEGELVYGVEIQEKYEWSLKLSLLERALHSRRPGPRIILRRDDIFTHRFPEEILKAQDVLIIGNPPWVTNAEVSAINGRNVPGKRNIDRVFGLEALTGRSNFDIAEFILFRLLDLFSGRRGVLAMLCKNSVVRDLVSTLPKRKFDVSNIRQFEIDAHREFGAAVGASLLVLDMGTGQRTFTCRTASLSHPSEPGVTFGWAGNRFVASFDGYGQVSQLDGESPLEWRQGVKHDCAAVMELSIANGILVNGNGERVEIEDGLVYQLLKSSDLRGFEAGRATKAVIITQRRIGDETSGLRTSAPKLWRYLECHAALLDGRRSRIYRGKPRFSMFGVGEYSFKLYKVAISGLYKHPRFCLVLPSDGRPVMLDDTCYFLGFDTYRDALFTASILNSPLVRRFLESIVFVDSKRPYTKDVLMRIDLAEVSKHLPLQNLADIWADMGYSPRERVTSADYEAYKLRILGRHDEGRPLQLRLNL